MSEPVPLRDYVDMRITAMEKIMEARFAALQRAVDVAEHRLEGKLAGMNEWRGALTDRDKDFAKQAQVTAIQRWIDISGGRWQALTIAAIGLGIVTGLIQLGRLTGLVRTLP